MGNFRSANRVVIVHDGRLAAGLGATVLARLLQRGDPQRTVTLRSLPPNSTSETFWANEALRLKELNDSSDTTLVLFGITFLDIDAESCIDILLDLHASFGSLEIWSHRWPDGFSKFVDVLKEMEDHPENVPTVRLPPDDIITDRELGILLSSDEKRLLRLTLYSGGIVVRNSPEDDLLVGALAQWISSGEESWNRLLSANDVGEIIQEALNDYTPERHLHRGAAIDEVSGPDNFIEVTITGDAAHQRKIEILDSVIDDRRLGDQAVVLGWLNKDRVLLYRRDSQHRYPSIRWLIENNLIEQVPRKLKLQHYGPQNSLYFPIDGIDRSLIRQPLRNLAIECARTTTGGRYLEAALARDIAAMANDVIRSIDLTKAYTSGVKPEITVDASKLYQLVHVSSRTGDYRRTLTLPVDVVGAHATAFLFRDGGYNFQKIERLLEGALIGLKWRSLNWLGEDSVPDRLRVDVRPRIDGDRSEGVDRSVGESIQGNPMKPIPADGLVNEESLIGRFLRVLGMDKLVCFAESETIGPSVAHALTLDAAASAVASGKPVRVLDLFAGSGVANRLLRSHGHDVVSVDLYVTASSVNLNATDTGLWLKADARKVLDRDSPLIERSFDVIGLDPPHSELVELLFGAPEHKIGLVELMADRADFMVMYQGHTTQRGRLSLLSQGLVRSGWSCVQTLQVEEELIMVGGKGRWGDQHEFHRLIDSIETKIQDFARTNAIGELNIRRVSVE